MKVVSVINIKGGVGKTTVTANLGAELASRGYRVLLIDLDPQASLSFSFFTIDHWHQELEPNKTIKRWFETAGKPDQVKLSTLVVTPVTVRANIMGNHGTLDLIASHLGLINIDIELAASLSGGNFHSAKESFMRVHRRLAEELKDRFFRSRYDVALIDCAPNFNILNKSAIIASDWMLIPARPDHLSTLGLDYLVRHKDDLVTGYNNYRRGDTHIPQVAPKILGVVFTMVAVHKGEPTRAHRQFMDEVKNHSKVPVFESIVRHSAGLFASAPRDGVPVAVKSSVQSPVADELDSIADEFIKLTDLKRKDP